MTGLIILFCLALLYLLWRLFRLLFSYFSEYFVLWVMANGGSDERRNISARMRLHIYVCPTELMDEASVVELYKFLNHQVDSSEDLEGFYKELLSYTNAVLLRDRRDGSLRGIFFLSLDRIHRDSRSYTILRPGLSFIDKEYRGGPYYYYIFAYLCIKEFILHPLTPFYVFGKLYSYKSYSVLAHTLTHVYPSYKWDTPEDIKIIINEFGHKLKLPNVVYDAERGVLKRESVRMKASISEASQADTSDPNVKFFMDINPGWAQGHLLLSIGRVDYSDIFKVGFRVIKAIMGRRGDKNKKSNRMRRNTFQFESADKLSKKVLKECDIHGQHHPAEAEEDGMEDLNDLIS